MERTIDRIKKEYNETLKNDKLEKYPGGCFVMKNEKRRESLRSEYISKLPRNKQLALWIHENAKSVLHKNHNTLSYEMNGVEDDWDGPTHHACLSMANEFLEVTDDIEMIKDFMKVIS